MTNRTPSLTSLQYWAWCWLHKTMPKENVSSLPERALRVFEEAAELCQAAGVDKSLLMRQTEYTYARPVGTVPQEIAGVLTTILGAASCAGIQAEDALMKELTRLDTPDVVEKVRRKQESKINALPSE